jgi:predicted porin
VVDPYYVQQEKITFTVFGVDMPFEVRLMRMYVLPALALLLLGSPSKAIEISGVTIYGKIIMSADYADNGEDGYLGITSSQSRLGFRGHFILTEDIKAIWQIESRIKFDVSGDEFAGRNSFVGFDTKYGTLKFGRHDTPYKLTNNKTDAFLNRYGDSRNVIGTWGGKFDVRADRMVMYESPSEYKAGYKILYKTESGEEGTDLLSGSFEYDTGGGLLFWAAGEIHGKMLTAVNDSTPSQDSEFGLRLAGAWRLESYSFFSLLEGLGNVEGLSGVSKYSWVFGIRYYLKNMWNLRAKYVGTNGRSDLEDSDGNMLAASLDLNLSESVLFFFAGAVTFNQENATYNMVNTGLFRTFLPVIGKDPWGFSLGTILAF